MLVRAALWQISFTFYFERRKVMTNNEYVFFKRINDPMDMFREPKKTIQKIIGIPTEV